MGTSFSNFSYVIQREKSDLGGLEERTKQKTEQKALIIIHRMALGTKTKMNLALDDFSLRSQQIVPTYSLYPSPKDFAQF